LWANKNSSFYFFLTQGVGGGEISSGGKKKTGPPFFIALALLFTKPSFIWHGSMNTLQQQLNITINIFFHFVPTFSLYFTK
jgi:hypothetical protein